MANGRPAAPEGASSGADGSAGGHTRSDTLIDMTPLSTSANPWFFGARFLEQIRNRAKPGPIRDKFDGHIKWLDWVAGELEMTSNEPLILMTLSRCGLSQEHRIGMVRTLISLHRVIDGSDAVDQLLAELGYVRTAKAPPTPPPEKGTEKASRPAPPEQGNGNSHPE